MTQKRTPDMAKRGAQSTAAPTGGVGARRFSLMTVAASLLSPIGVNAPAAMAQDTHILNMRNADIQELIQDVSSVTRTTFIVHPAVKGKVTVTSQTPLSEEEVFEVFLATLRVLNYTVIPTEQPGAYRIVPDSTAAEDIGVIGAAGRPSDQFATEVIRLKYFNAVEAAKMVTPLVNGRGKVTANPDGNILIVVDYAGNIQRIRRILEDADRDDSVITTIRLNNMPAAEAARILNEFNDGNRRGAANAGASGVTAVAVESGNALLLRGEASQVTRMQALARELDAANEPSETLRVIYLKHAVAADIVPTLEAVAASMARPGAQQASVTIPFDAATNALVLSAEPQTLNALTRVIEYLDIRRSQVQIEAIIVEVSDDAARELGLEFVLSGTNSNVPFVSTSFTNSAPNILALSGAALLDEFGFDSDIDGDGEDDISDTLTAQALNSLLGVTGGTIGFGREFNDGTLFSVILNAVETDEESNLLSTPSVTTLDNEEARIFVGQEIPITTGSSLGNDNVNPFVTTQRQDVGIELKVTPQISDDGVIRLSILQEVDSIAQTISNGNTDFITDKRSVETSVLADNGEIIVLGGLIEQDDTLIRQKVPLLGDIPLLGRLFRNDAVSSRRTNLVVFLRPTILRSEQDVRAVTNQRFEYINGQTDRAGTNLNRFLRDVMGVERPSSRN